MEDSEIIALYFNRDERAIEETNKKYGRYCASIAKNILGSDQSAEECLSDALLSAWSSIPPERPRRLSAYLGRLARNAAFNRYKQARAEKRGGGELPLVLDELAQCVSSRDTVENQLDSQELARALNSYVAALPAERQRAFILRYYHAMKLADIAERMGRSQPWVAKTLERERTRLKKYLIERGFEI